VNKTNGNRSNGVNETEIVGCPSVQRWCYYIPAMTVTQFLLGYAFISVGYPIGVTLIQTIFSKVLGPRPQVSSHGWMATTNGEERETIFFPEKGETSALEGEDCIQDVLNNSVIY
jgi:hypothetical protein